MPGDSRQCSFEGFEQRPGGACKTASASSKAGAASAQEAIQLSGRNENMELNHEKGD